MTTRFRYAKLLLCIASTLTLGQSCSSPAPSSPPPNNNPPPPVVTSCGLIGNACNIPAGAEPSSVALADLDGDGDLDLAVANFGLDSVAIFFNDGKGAFKAGATFAAGDSPNSIFAADLDGDGDIDLAVASTSGLVGAAVAIFKNDGTGKFGTATAFAVGGVAVFVTGADLDGDGDVDLVTANSVTNNVSVILNDGKAKFGPPVNFPVGQQPMSIAVADLDGDGDLDLAVANHKDNTVSVLRNLGNASFLGATNTPAGIGPTSVVAGNFDDDIDIDLAVANESKFDETNFDSVTILPNNGNASFATPRPVLVGINPRFLAVGDFDGDGSLDLAVANFGFGTGTSNLAILLNNGSGVLGPATTFLVGDGPQSIAVGDLDDDGDLDLVIGNSISNNLSFLNNDGTGDFGGGG